MKMFIVTAVDTSDTADGKARVLATFASKEDAAAFVKNDMEIFIEDANGMDLVVDWDDCSIQTEDGNYGCEWNYEEVDVKFPNN